MNCYQTIAERPEKLIDILRVWQDEFHGLIDKKEQKKHYYNQKRTLYNQTNTDIITQSALFIFLNLAFIRKSSYSI